MKDKRQFLGSMTLSLSDFSTHIKEWNRSVYGFLVTCKRNLMKSLLNIQQALDHSHFSRLQQLEIAVRNDLEIVLDHESYCGNKKRDAIGFNVGIETPSIFIVGRFSRENSIILLLFVLIMEIGTLIKIFSKLKLWHFLRNYMV